MPRIEVEDHGNGFMVVGTNDYRKAAKILRDYVDRINLYRFACPTWYQGRMSCWLTTHPAAHWDGARDHVGEPLPR